MGKAMDVSHPRWQLCEEGRSRVRENKEKGWEMGSQNVLHPAKGDEGSDLGFTSWICPLGILLILERSRLLIPLGTSRSSSANRDDCEESVQ